MGLYLKDMELPNAIQGVRTVNIHANGEVTNYAGEVIATAVSVRCMRAQVRHGKWIDSEPDKQDLDYRKNGMAYYCSCCLHNAGKYKHRTYKYCPWCGALMDGRIEDGDA